MGSCDQSFAFDYIFTDFGKIVSCCTRVSSRKPKDVLVNFLIQKEDLPCVEAIFISTAGPIPWLVQIFHSNYWHAVDIITSLYTCNRNTERIFKILIVSLSF
uniref:Uncharacterized protein n=1 Tax=Xenopus tropicalis TaxID=8364 RepID=A0A6I8RFS6_XENTR